LVLKKNILEELIKLKNMNLRSVEEVLPNTRVILRMDLDVAEGDNSRLIKSIPTIKLLLEKNCKIAIIGHKGRPSGADPSLSLKSVYLDLMSMIEPVESIFIEEINNQERLDLSLVKNQIIFLENLRFWPGESADAKAMADEGKFDGGYLKSLVEITNFYVDDAFAVAHRPSPSMMLYKIMPGFYGLNFIEEIEKINKVIENPQRPMTIILGGAKEDKLKNLDKLTEVADKVLIGGKLPMINDKYQMTNDKVMMAKLREDKTDLSDEDIEKFTEIINNSKTIVWAGAMGWFEKEDSKKGTVEIAKAVANSSAYKIIAGGDTGASIRQIGMMDKIDLECSGGGVMLELLAGKSLPAVE